MNVIPLVRGYLLTFLLAPLSAVLAQEALSVAFPTTRESIESNLPSMEWERIDTSHFDSEEGVFGIEVWTHRGGMVGKIKVYSRDSESDRDDKIYNAEEFWLHLGEPVAHRRVSFYPGSAYEDITTFRDGKLVSSLTRFADSGGEQVPDISSAKFEETDPESLNDEEWVTQVFEDTSRNAEKMLVTAEVVQSLPGGKQSLLSQPYRIHLEDVSPDGSYALAWSIEGVGSPDWERWENESWQYLESFGEFPNMPISVVSLKTGSIVGQLGQDMGAEGWAEWSPDGRMFVYFVEVGHVVPLESSVYRVGPDGVSMIISDFPAAVGQIAMKELEKVGHPYCVRRSLTKSDDEEGSAVDTWISDISESGVFSVETSFGLHMESRLDQASLNIDLKIDPTTGALQLVSSKIAEFPQIPMNWEEAVEVISTSAASWLTSPPQVEEQYRFATWPETGILGLYNEFGAILTPEVIEVLLKRSLYKESTGFLNLYTPYEFARYDPQAIAEIDRELSRFLNPAVFATRGLYEAKFKTLARDFNEALRYWEEHPAELKRQGEVYLKHIKNGTLPDGYYLLDGDLADRLMEEYSSEFDAQLHYLTAIRFWMRRSIDGSKDEFASILQKTIRAFDSEYYSNNGFPDLIIDRP